MKTYYYQVTTENGKGATVEIQADDILEADKKYQAMTGLNPAKPPKGMYIGCRLRK